MTEDLRRVRVLRAANRNSPHSPDMAPRSLHISEWPRWDQDGWATACLPGERLKRGGAASYLAPVSRADYANRYGLYLDFLQRSGRLDQSGRARTLITPANVNDFIAELQSRQSSVTVWNSVSKLRRAAQLIAPGFDLSWLAEVEKDLALVMEPRSKNGRIVLAEVIVEAGLTLIEEAEAFAKADITRALGVRDGLMIALLALHPIRVKNFAGLVIGDTLKNVEGTWWIRLPPANTKSHRLDERRVPDFVTPIIDRYVIRHHVVLACGNTEQRAFWLSSTSGRQMTVKDVGHRISELTLRTLGVGISPHLFRDAGASTAAVYCGANPHIGSTLLNHRDRRVAEEHYNHATSLSASQIYLDILEGYRDN